MTTNAAPHLFWITSRAAGFTALIVASVGVSVGLLMSTKLIKGRVSDFRVVHEVLSLAAIAAIVVHGVTLIGDQFLRLSVVDIAVPFASGYKTFWTSLGIIGGWGLIVLGLSYYARRWIGGVRWRKLHRFTALVWLFGLAHSLGEGTDAGQAWFLAMVAVVVAPALILLGRRLWPRADRPASGRLAGARPGSSRPGTRVPRPVRAS